MIAPAFLIKILGCATVGAFLTIGIPIIVVKENEKKVVARQADIDKPTFITSFLTSLVSATGSVLKPGEKFSDAAFTSWSPKNETEKTSIATNFSSIIKHMPNAFFEKLKNKTLTQGTGVCHIQASGTTVSQQINQALYIPFLISEITSELKSPLNGSGPNLNLVVVQAKGNSMETHLGEDFLKTDKANFKKELKAISDGTKAPHKRVPESQPNSQPSERETAIAKDLLFLQTLYEATIDRLTKELGNPDTSHTGGGLLWGSISCQTESQ